MSSFLVGMLWSVAVAFLLLRLVDRRSCFDRRIGEALILGVSLPALALAVLSLASVPWSRGSLALVGVIATVGLVIPQRSGDQAGERRPEVAVVQSRTGLVVSVAFAMVTIALLLGYGQFAFVSAGAENDFIGIWGAKGRTFYESGGVDWEFLRSPWRGYAHPDYPILVPLIFASIAILATQWSESLIGLVHPALALGGLILIWSEFQSRGVSAARTWLCVLASTPFVLSPWIGLADGPLTVIALAGLLRLARWLERREGSDLTVGAVFMGLAMSTKNEGIALGVVAAVMLWFMTPAQSRRGLVRLWPVALLGLPWIAIRSARGLGTDLFAGGFVGRLLSRLFDADYLVAMGGHLVRYKPGIWIVLSILIVAAVVSRKQLTTGARFILAVTGIQALIYLVAYLVTPLPLEWHVRWSWERLVSHVGAAFAVAVIWTLLRDDTADEEHSIRGGLGVVIGAGPEVEGEKPDTDADC